MEMGETASGCIVAGIIGHLSTDKEAVAAFTDFGAALNTQFLKVVAASGKGGSIRPGAADVIGDNREIVLDMNGKGCVRLKPGRPEKEKIS
jgi:hypothetical protein